MNDQSNLYSFQAYHASGLKVFFAFPFASFAETSAAIEQALAAGFTVDPRGVEPGEKLMDIGWVCLALKRNDDNTTTPRVAYYPDDDKLKRKEADQYLNTPEEIAAFEAATGLKINEVPPCPQMDRYIKFPDRDNEVTKQFIVRCKRISKMVYIDNPEYNPNADNPKDKGLKHLFVRWHSAAPAAPHTEQQPGNDKPATPKNTNGAPPMDALRAQTLRKLSENKYALTDVLKNEIDIASTPDEIKVGVLIGLASEVAKTKAVDAAELDSMATALTAQKIATFTPQHVSSALARLMSDVPF